MTLFIIFLFKITASVLTGISNSMVKINIEVFVFISVWVKASLFSLPGLVFYVFWDPMLLKSKLLVNVLSLSLVNHTLNVRCHSVVPVENIL